MALPLSATTKSALWVLLFGLAKTAQYTGLAILGIDGWHRVKEWFKKRKIKG
jgi:phosphoglycolate phosphatase